MAKRDLRLAVAEFGAVNTQFEAVTTFGRPGQRTLPGAFLVERQMLVPDSDQPRKVFDQGKLEELAESIRQVGVLQPLRVRSNEDGKYIIVNGERRWRACMLADVPEIPVVVRDSPADQLAFEMLVENLQREDLSDEEEAQAYRLLIDQGYGVGELARRLGVSKARISKNVRVYANDTLARAIVSGQLTKAQAQEILPAEEAYRPQIIEVVGDAKQRGEKVTADTVRELVRHTRESVSARNIGSDTDPTVSGRNTSLQPLAPAVITLNNLARQIESFCDKHGTTAFTEEQKEPLRKAWERLSLALREQGD